MFRIPACASMSANDPSQPAQVHASTWVLANAASRSRNKPRGTNDDVVFIDAISLLFEGIPQRQADRARPRYDRSRAITPECRIRNGVHPQRGRDVVDVNASDPLRPREHDTPI